MGVLLAGCTARGGGYLPPDGLFTGQASLGFTVSCERSNTNTNAPAGQLRIEMAYLDQGTHPVLPAPFGIHGIVDGIDPVDESMLCIGQDRPPIPNALTFVGRYRLVSSPPAGFPSACALKNWTSGSNCRFKVIVTDNDLDRAPSKGDGFSIWLSTLTNTRADPAATAFYIRAGLLAGGNLTVD